MLMDFITSNIIGPVKGGIMVSHGTWFTAAFFLGLLKVKSIIQSRRRG